MGHVPHKTNIRALRAANKSFSGNERRGDWKPQPTATDWAVTLAVIIAIILLLAAYAGAFDSQIGAVYRAVGLL
jgi:hypothetical protein